MCEQSEDGAVDPTREEDRQTRLTRVTVRR